MTIRWCVMLAVLLCGSGADAADVLFRNIVWPRHDKQTGMLEWELRARTARPVSDHEYACSHVDLYTYEVVQENGQQRSRKELYLRADRGTYGHSANMDTAKLDGHVRTKLFGEDPIRISTAQAELECTWDNKKQIKTRTITSQSKVTMTSRTRDLTGDGMTVFKQTTGKKITKSWLRLQRNVVMVIHGVEAAERFAVLPGSEAAPETRGQAAPMTISCLGQLVFDRVENRACFHQHVVLSGPTGTINCDRLTLHFQQAKGKAEPELTRLVAEENVALRGKDEHFSGNRFEWDPSRRLGKLAGRPARMTAPDTSAVAETIEFDQNAQLIRYTGNAEVRIDLKPE